MEKSKLDYHRLGAHRVETDGREYWDFAVYAPRAQAVSLVGEFNNWDNTAARMSKGDDGVWTLRIEGVRAGMLYKFAILGRNGEWVMKADPYAFRSELRPGTASITHDLPSIEWTDRSYMRRHRESYPFDDPINIYEVHLPSWKTDMPIEQEFSELVAYAKDMGYTHIELLPIMEYPLDDSWGYQVTGYYSVSARFGTPENLMRFIDKAHQEGIGVILDWVPAHFTKDAHGLRCFDGEPMFESPDPLRAEMPQWGTLLFNFERLDVCEFLILNAIYYLKEFHADGLRVDAVSCMLYHDFGKEFYRPNRFGGRENLDAIEFLKDLNTMVHAECPGSLMIAEESSAYPKVTEPVYNGGLGFDFKWNMGFMNDTLSYFELDPIYRKYHHDKLTFPLVYAFSEKHILPFSHDEVVCGKRSLIGRMHGDYEQQFRQLRLLFAYQMASPGKKLNFMGNEFGQFIEWAFRRPLDWFLLDYPAHASMQRFVRSLNRFYLSTTALHSESGAWNNFAWLALDDRDNSVISFMRTNKKHRLICVFNFTPTEHRGYRIDIGKYFNRPVTLECVFSTHPGHNDVIRSQKIKNGQRYFDVDLYGFEGTYFRVKTGKTPDRLPGV